MQQSKAVSVGLNFSHPCRARGSPGLTSSKCTGERPCSSCIKHKVECRYEDLPRKKNRSQLLEERIGESSRTRCLSPDSLPPVELERLLAMRTGHEVPHFPAPLLASPETPLSGDSSGPYSVGNALPPNLTPVNAASASTDIPPQSLLESALIRTIMPYLPFILMPVHPERFFALLSLPTGDPRRPHPALLYVMFAEAVRVVEQRIPPPTDPAGASTSSGGSSQGLLNPDGAFILQHLIGSFLTLLERARVELDRGVRNVDRPFDLVRAAVGITRCLYSLGRFIEAFSTPVARLVVSCGLHRATGTIVPPPATRGSGTSSLVENLQRISTSTSISTSSTYAESGLNVLPEPYAPAQYYLHLHSSARPVSTYPIMRMRPTILPPPRDEIDVAERSATFWAAKVQDWEAGTGWGWSLGLDDNECTVRWPWGSGVPEVSHKISSFNCAEWEGHARGGTAQCDGHPKHGQPRWYHGRHNVRTCREEHRSTSPRDEVGEPTPIVQSISSPRAGCSTLPSVSKPQISETILLPPSHIPPISEVEEVLRTLRLFRSTISPNFAETSYDGTSDPWWIVLQFNVLAAEMFALRELAHYRPEGYEQAVEKSREIVRLARTMRPDSWTHVGEWRCLKVSTFLPLCLRSVSLSLRIVHLPHKDQC